ncbi:hypothetical protein MSG28_011260 [Choristoneura fumiferana]|uniref:Uncharacterized protein n=1 Tax=Choristoneura fumiferana TaxID=7141 RepID=A0ACC0KRE1_CHOFU|nr:hypothetical protein MSG28_011260 [Choristoneura fumiferana]
MWFNRSFVYTRRVQGDLLFETDERGIAVKIYEGVVTTLEVILLLIKMTITFFYSMYQLAVPPEPKSVEGEIILITGAGHGMGREVALRFAKLGGTIVCIDINAAGNQETVDMIKANQGKAHRFECDVTDSAAVSALAERVRREVGEVTMLINNAGIMPCKPLAQHAEKEIRTMFEVNVLAHFWMLQAFLPSMMERNHGHIVAMSSMAGILGLRNLVPYCASKFAVRGMMEALHEEMREDAKDYSGVMREVVTYRLISKS